MLFLPQKHFHFHIFIFIFNHNFIKCYYYFDLFIQYISWKTQYNACKYEAIFRLFLMSEVRFSFKPEV